MNSKILLMSALIIGGASAAYAQDAAPAPVASTTATTTTTTTVDVPTCSRTVMDKCINRTSTRKVVAHKAVRHHKTAVKKTSTVTTKTEG